MNPETELPPMTWRQVMQHCAGGAGVIVACANIDHVREVAVIMRNIADRRAPRMPEAPGGGRMVTFEMDVTPDVVVSWDITPESARVLGEYLIQAAGEAVSRPL